MHILHIYKLATKQIWIKKAQTTHNQENLYKNRKKIHKNMCKKGYMSPLPPHLNLTMSSLGAGEPQPRTKIQKYKIKEIKQGTNIDKLTLKSKTQPHPIN